jgi:hypothetical protein
MARCHLRLSDSRGVKWHAFTDGTTFTGFVFGSGSVLARIYNKSYQARQKLDDAYFALLAERNPATFDPTQDVWRLEFQQKRKQERQVWRELPEGSRACRAGRTCLGNADCWCFVP